MLTKFKFVRTEGLKGLMVKGRFIPFEKIDDTLAETLLTQTHVLERLPVTEPTTVPVVLALAEPATEAEATTSTKTKK